MDHNFNLTNIEQQTLTTVRQLLGDKLSDFLLSGLGESKFTHRRSFSTHSTSPHVEARSYQFEMISQSSHGLPIDRDPLVLAALLDLLCERQPLDSTILFRHSDILQRFSLGCD